MFASPSPFLAEVPLVRERELLACRTHHDVIDEPSFLERSIPQRGLAAEPASLVRPDDAGVRRERPQLDLMQIEPVERVGQQGHRRVARVPLAPERRLPDVDVQRADPVTAPEPIEADPPDGFPLHGDDQGEPLHAGTRFVLLNVLRAEGPFVVHVPPHLWVVLPHGDERKVRLLGGAQQDPFASDHRATARGLRSAPPTTSRYTDRTSAVVASHENRRAWATAARPMRRASGGGASRRSRWSAYCPGSWPSTRNPVTPSRTT